jgi:hypothetical protein
MEAQKPEFETVQVTGMPEPLFLTEVMKEKAKLLPKADAGSIVGRQEHPIDYEAAVRTMLAVSTQATCIMTKRDATVGLGFETAEQRKKRKEEAMPPPQPGPNPIAQAKALMDDTGETSKVDEVLDDLCEVSFQSLINEVGEDYENTGNGYFEVQRESDTSPIVSMWHYFSPMIYVVVEEGGLDKHFEVDSPSGTVKFARFGDLQGFRQRNPNVKQETLTEMIPFRMPTASCQHYGLPQWLGCVPWLEIAQHMMSYESDYYQNRSVPDLLAFFKGMNLSAEAQKEMKQMIKDCVGPGKRHRSMAFFLPKSDSEIQIERLSTENREKLADSWSTVALEIVSSHRVPPLLAGITVPGKMGAANELPNALIAFQQLYIAQHQKIFQRVLGKTLGSPEAGLGLSPTDFLPRRITDFYDIGQMDTMSRMRQPLAGSGRNLSQGLKD